MRYDYQEDFEAIVVERKARTNEEKSMKLAAMLFTEASCIGKLEFEIDKEKYYGRNENGEII